MLAILLILSVIGCSNSKEVEPSTGDDAATVEETATEEPSDNVQAGPAVDKDTVVIATADEAPSLDPMGHNAVAGTYLNTLTHNGLFRLDNDLNPIPHLVKDYKIEQDEDGIASIWVMTLNEGIKFHDGTIVTSEDVVASLMEARNHPEVLTYTRSIMDAEVVDDLTFKIFTDGASSALLYDLSHHTNNILPKALIDAGNDFNVNPIGTGA